MNFKSIIIKMHLFIQHECKTNGNKETQFTQGRLFAENGALNV